MNGSLKKRGGGREERACLLLVPFFTLQIETLFTLEKSMVIGHLV